MAPPKLLVLDSSVFVAALREAEPTHKVSRNLLKRVVDGEFLAIEPFTVLVEVVAAVRRRTGDRELAEQIGTDLLRFGEIQFQELTKYRALDAMEIAGRIGVRGMDAVVLQTARENDALLVTHDQEMARRARGLSTISIGDIAEL